MVDTELFFSEDVMSRVREALGIGALVGISCSRDGGALSIALTFSGNTERDWFRDPAAAVMWLDDMLGLLHEAAQENPPPASRGGAARGRQNGR